ALRLEPRREMKRLEGADEPLVGRRLDQQVVVPRHDRRARLHRLLTARLEAGVEERLFDRRAFTREDSREERVPRVVEDGPAMQERGAQRDLDVVELLVDLVELDRQLLEL